MIRINCSGCGGILTIPVDLAGTEAKCPGCKVSFLVPDQPSDDEQPGTSDDAESNDVDSESSDFDPMDILNEPTPQKRGVHVTPREPRLESAAPAASEPEKELPRTDTDTAAAAVDAMAAMNRGPRPTKATAPVTPTTASATTAVPRFNLREAFASPENFFDAISESKIYVVLAVCLLAAFVFYMPKGCDTGVPRYPVSGRVLFTDGTPVKTGVVEFESVEHQLSATGRINDDGSFTCPEGMPAGPSRAIVTQMIISDGTIKHEKDHGKPVGYRYRRYETSGLKFDILAQDQNDLKVEVVQEVEQKDGYYGDE